MLKGIAIFFMLSLHLFNTTNYTDFYNPFINNIICMANNIENRDAYIIIGIDEENDFSITGVEEDNNRRNTQNLVDFLKDIRSLLVI